MAAIEHQHGSARTLILGLVDMQITVFEIQGQSESLALQRRKQRLTHIEIQRIAELIQLR